MCIRDSHKGLNGGTTPWNYHIILNDATTEGAYSFINQPNTIDFAVTSGWQANNKNYMAMLFASVDGTARLVITTALVQIRQ